MSDRWHSLVYWCHVWRRIHCHGDMRRDEVHGRAAALSDARFIDSGYCLDRYSLLDAR